MTSVQIIANPAVPIGRMFSDTFAGIDPELGTRFIAAQIVGAPRAGADRWLYPDAAESAGDAVVPHH